MFPATTGARPGNRNIMSFPNSANSRLLPDRNPSPTPTSNSSDPTPQAIPNMVRNERSLFAHKLRRIWVKMSWTVLIIEKPLRRHSRPQPEALIYKTPETLWIFQSAQEKSGSSFTLMQKFRFPHAPDADHFPDSTDSRPSP